MSGLRYMCCTRAFCHADPVAVPAGNTVVYIVGPALFYLSDQFPVCEEGVVMPIISAWPLAIYVSFARTSWNPAVGM